MPRTWSITHYRFNPYDLRADQMRTIGPRIGTAEFRLGSRRCVCRAIEREAEDGTLVVLLVQKREVIIPGTTALKACVHPESLSGELWERRSGLEVQELYWQLKSA